MNMAAKVGLVLVVFACLPARAKETTVPRVWQLSIDDYLRTSGLESANIVIMITNVSTEHASLYVFHEPKLIGMYLVDIAIYRVDATAKTRIPTHRPIVSVKSAHDYRVISLAAGEKWTAVLPLALWLDGATLARGTYEIVASLATEPLSIYGGTAEFIRQSNRIAAPPIRLAIIGDR